MKYLLPREYLALAERALRDYPERNRESKLVAKAVRAMCHSPVHGTGPVSIPASEPERVTEALEILLRRRRRGRAALERGTGHCQVRVLGTRHESRDCGRAAYGRTDNETA